MEQLSDSGDIDSHCHLETIIDEVSDRPDMDESKNNYEDSSETYDAKNNFTETQEKKYPTPNKSMYV